MANIVKMTVKDRHNIIKYGYNLPSTLQTYFPFFDQFLSIFEFTPEEEKEYGIKIVDGEITCNCPDKLFDIDVDQVPEGIHAAIKMRVTDYKAEMKKLRDANKDNKDYKDSPLFVAIVENLSKLLTAEEIKETEPEYQEKLAKEKEKKPILKLIKR
jgi:hypothetical protein